MEFITHGQFRTLSNPEVTNVSSHGFWLLIAEHERFVSFKAFPWFRDASIVQLTNVELPSPHHLYWPDLDVDLAVDSLDHPERYALVSQARRNRRPTPAPTAAKEARAAYKRIGRSRRGLAAGRYTEKMVKKPAKRFRNIDSLVSGDGDVSIGRIGPVRCAAVASDEDQQLAALVRRPRESLEELLARLDAAIERAWEEDVFLDEING